MAQFTVSGAYGPYEVSGAPVAGNNEIQTIVGNSTITAGTFRLSFGGEVTADIPWNAPTSQVETALNNLRSIAAGGTATLGVAVTGGALPGTLMTLTFSGANVVQNAGAPLLVLSNNSLTGGGSITIARTQTAVAATARGALR